jgi:hypothetical protein
MAKKRRDLRNKTVAKRAGAPKTISGRRPGADDVLERIAAALERLAPRPPAAPDFLSAEAFVWHPDGRRLAPVARINRVDM